MPLVTGFLNTDAMNSVECPRCYQPAGTCCMDHRGKKLSQTHPGRLEAYRTKFPDRAKLYAAGVDRAVIAEYNRKLAK